jgi:AcrR family transcriptional regulator
MYKQDQFHMTRVNDAVSSAEQRILDAALRLYAKTGRTDLTISELASEAGVARGTVYHYIQPTNTLFENVTTRLAEEMYRRVNKSLSTSPDAENPLARMAMGIRLYIRRAHDEPLWGRFIYSFGFRAEVLHDLCGSAPTQNILAGLQAGQYQTQAEHLHTTVSFIAGVVTGAIHLVATGHDTWRNAGADAVEFVFKALGVPAATASCLANRELPPLSPDD